MKGTKKNAIRELKSNDTERQNQWTEDTSLLQQRHFKWFTRLHSVIDVIAKSPKCKQTFSLFLFALVVTRSLSLFLSTTHEQINFFSIIKTKISSSRSSSNGQIHTQKTPTQSPEAHVFVFDDCEVPARSLFSFRFGIVSVVYSPNDKPKWKQQNGDLDGNQFTFEHLFLFALASHFRLNGKIEKQKKRRKKSKYRMTKIKERTNSKKMRDKACVRESTQKQWNSTETEKHESTSGFSCAHQTLLVFGQQSKKKRFQAMCIAICFE